MSKKAFESIAAGLRDAIAYAEGDPSRLTRVHRPVPPIDVKAVRTRRGMTQKDFAHTFSIPLPTLVKWEQGQSGPTGSTRLLLHIIDRHPRTVQRACRLADAHERIGRTPDQASDQTPGLAPPRVRVRKGGVAWITPPPVGCCL